ncbi:MAG: TetR/AcrR family transcriptional regulator [Spirochaetales bacterium]|nr:TetR/AcrR family transcriptional regulator [Spirochaetales bacterium]MCF7937976.1 TetR/AcrR family transcriptional regulator [Spirochaetales bacterium]
MTKREERKKEIMDTAFLEWSNTLYQNTNLNQIASSMGMTKPAIYRYFKSKEHLIQAMDRRLIEEYVRMHEELFNQQSIGSVRELIRTFVRFHYEFYRNRPGYYLFYLMNTMQKQFSERKEVKRITNRLVSFFQKHLSAEGIPWQDDWGYSFFHFLYSTTMYWQAPLFIPAGFIRYPSEEEEPARISGSAENTTPAQAGTPRGENKGPDEQPPCADSDPEEIQTIIETIVMEGMLREPSPSTGRLAVLQNDCVVKPEEMPEPHRLFTAIEQAVAEKGFEHASLDEIARRAGMTKSSLYFYFDNKENMLASMVHREQEKFLELITKRRETCATPAESFFCYMVSSATFSLNNPSLLTAYNWVRYQNIDFRKPRPTEDLLQKVFRFVREAIDHSQLTINNLDYRLIGSYLHMITFYLVLEGHDTGRHTEEILNYILHLYNLFSKGLEGRMS